MEYLNLRLREGLLISVNYKQIETFKSLLLRFKTINSPEKEKTLCNDFLRCVENSMKHFKIGDKNGVNSR